MIDLKKLREIGDKATVSYIANGKDVKHVRVNQTDWTTLLDALEGAQELIEMYHIILKQKEIWGRPSDFDKEQFKKTGRWIDQFEGKA